MKEAVVYTNEADFRKWFEKNLDRFGIKEIIVNQEVCPDYVVIMNDGKTARIEVELFSENFKYHRHDPNKVDYIVACYSKKDNMEGVPVMTVHRLWCFDLEPLDCIPPNDPLDKNEAGLLASVHVSGGISISALSHGKLAGNKELWMRVPPEIIAKIRRSRIDDSIFNVLTQPAKEWLRRYHHLLIGSGISEEGCLLLESLRRRGLIASRPIEIIASLYDGVFIDHPAWFPIEVYTTPDAWKYHKDEILNSLKSFW